MPILIREGQQIPLTPEQAATDETLIKTLLPFYADVAGATLTRKMVDGEEHIEIVKKVGTKGNVALVNSLKAAPEAINPALALSWKLKQLELQGQLTVETLIEIREEIDAAIAQAEIEIHSTSKTISNLIHSSPQPSCYPILCF